MKDRKTLFDMPKLFVDMSHQIILSLYNICVCTCVSKKSFKKSRGYREMQVSNYGLLSWAVLLICVSLLICCSRQTDVASSHLKAQQLLL